MTKQADHAVAELGLARLALREDLVFSPRGTAADGYYLVEDPLASKFYRFGMAEYTFVSLLDGQTTVAAAVAQTARLAPQRALSEQQATAVCKWLLDNGLAQSPAGGGPVNNTDERKKPRWNPLVAKVPLFRPQRFFARVTPALGWLFSAPALVAWLALVLAAVYQVASHRERFAASTEGLFAPGNWFWLAVCWVLLKCVHECAHAIVCTRHGGFVREAGVLFILLAPIAYVDVTSGWRFRSRWPQIHTAAAGMYVELLIAALAALAWSVADEGPWSHLCANVVMMASFTTLVFNANPLMRFDGYYMLADALGITNLYGNGRQWVTALGKRKLLGVSAMLPAWPPRQRRIIAAYGIAALVWRVFICVSLILAAAVMFAGAGVILSCFAILSWWAMPAWRFVHYLFRPSPGEQPNRLRFLFMSGLGALVLILLSVLPWPGATQAPAVVEYAPGTVIRAKSPGFVHQLRVKEGQRVREGDMLMVLVNRELAAEAAELQLAARASCAQARRLQQQGKLAAYQAERKNTESIRRRLHEKSEQLDHLVIRASQDGCVVARGLANTIGLYRQVGDELVVIGEECRKELRLAISQDDAQTFTAHVSKAVSVRMAGRPAFQARLDHIAPRASETPSHLAFCASYGGPLPVYNREPLSSAEVPDAGVRLLHPRLTGTMKLTPAQSRLVRAGEVGMVSLRPFRRAVLPHVADRIVRWVRDSFTGIRTSRTQ